MGTRLARSSTGRAVRPNDALKPTKRPRGAALLERWRRVRIRAPGVSRLNAVLGGLGEDRRVRAEEPMRLLIALACLVVAGPALAQSEEPAESPKPKTKLAGVVAQGRGGIVPEN